MPSIFYSWQADTPPPTGRNFLERALEKAIAAVRRDIEIDAAIRELELDRDTKGVSGSPPITDTILGKIDTAWAAVADVTFVGSRRDGRPTPNPNVLIEYGWALKSLGHERVITVMNSAYGEPNADTLPFDMAHVRFPIQYRLAEGAGEEAIKEERAKLVPVLSAALSAVLKKGPPRDPRVRWPTEDQNALVKVLHDLRLGDHPPYRVEIRMASKEFQAMADLAKATFESAGWTVDLTLSPQLHRDWRGIEVHSLSGHLRDEIAAALRRIGVQGVRATEKHVDITPENPKWPFALRTVELRLGYAD